MNKKKKEKGIVYGVRENVRLNSGKRTPRFQRSQRWENGVGRGGGQFSGIPLSCISRTVQYSYTYPSARIYWYLLIILLFPFFFVIIFGFFFVASGTILPFLLSVSSCFKGHYAVLVGKIKLLNRIMLHLFGVTWNLWSVLLLKRLINELWVGLSESAIILN